MPADLKNQIALVTGGSSGLGLGIVHEFARAGAAVGINYHAHAEPAEQAAAEIKRAGGRAIALKADVSKENEVIAMVDAVIREWGALDIMVANSGVQQDAPVADMTLEQWNTVLALNLTGEFLCAREAIRRFRAQGERSVSRAKGKILCMSSVHEVIPWAGHVNYAAAKGGVGMMMRTLAQEVAAEGIRVNGIAPGAIKTHINREQTEGAAGERLLKLIPYKRIGEAADVARAAAWLVSDDADYVVGATLFVDGGMTLYPGFEDNG